MWNILLAKHVSPLKVHQPVRVTHHHRARQAEHVLLLEVIDQEWVIGCQAIYAFPGPSDFEALKGPAACAIIFSMSLTKNG